MFIAALFPISKIWKQPNYTSTDEWIKSWYVYINVYIYINIYEYYLAMRKKDILPLVTTWVDLEGTMLSEISQRENDKYHMISLICGI